MHGGPHFVEPVVIDEEVVAAIHELETIAPLHNAPALRGIEEARQRFPVVPHVAVFDTAFHATIPEAAATYAVPRRWRTEWGVRRYGFHGISVEWSVGRAAQLLGRPAEELRMVVCHLGGGSSVTAVRGGCSVDTTMGFSPLEGIPMNNRSGSVDPGVLLYVQREHGMSVDALDHALNHDSGVVALAGGGAGLREVEAAAEQGGTEARLAMDVYAHRLASAISAMAASAGGIDVLVFTAGIGEKSASVRSRACQRLGFLGIRLDDEANERATLDSDVAAADSAGRVLVIRAREGVVGAKAARRLLGMSD